MSKVLRDAALVVGVVALAATGIGAAGSAGLITLSAATAATVSTVATVAGLASVGAGVIASLTAKKPSQQVSPMRWRSDPEAGIPYVMGRFYQGGQIVYRQAWKDNNSNETIVTAVSAGPIDAFETFYVDGVATTISGAQANITDRGKLYISNQLGAQPEARQLGDLGPPGWSNASKLSGLAAHSITLVYDPKGKVTFTTEPLVGFVVRGVHVYDPRKDSSYPGGSGPQRATDETTWTYSTNPFLHALTWLIGRRHNGKLVLGVGVPLATILMPQYVEGANVADANGWTISGAVSSTDQKWDALKRILAAGAGEPLRLGAQIGCLVQTPRVSLATLTADDVIGEATVQATQARRDRINAIVPRYMAEQSETLSVNGKLQTTTSWGLLSASPVVVQDYVTFDGGQRQKQVDYEFVTALKQAQQLARYDIENAREFGPITLPCKLRWYGYKPGDVVTIQHPELGLPNQDVMILSRSLSPANCTVTMTMRSETYAKHAFALGQTGTAPATPSVSGPPLIPTPGATAWAITAEAITSNGTTIPALVVEGAVDSAGVDAVFVEYRVSVTGEDDGTGWETVGLVPPATTRIAITGVQDKAAYQVAVSYQLRGNLGARLILGPVTAGQTSVPWSTGVADTDPDHPKPADGADVTVDVFNGLDQGRSPQKVLDDLDLQALNVLAGATDLGNFKVAIGKLLTDKDGNPIGVTIAAVQATVNGQQAVYANLVRTDDGQFRVVTTLNEGGVITGTENIITGDKKSEYYVASDIFGWEDTSNPGNPVKPVLFENGIAYFDHIAVRQLDYDRASTSSGSSSTASVAGTYASTTGAPPQSEVLTASIMMKAPGWVTAFFKGHMGYSNAPASAPYFGKVLFNGNDEGDSYINGAAVPTDNFVSIGRFYVGSPQMVTVSAQWGGHQSISLLGRNLTVLGQPFTTGG